MIDNDISEHSELLPLQVEPITRQILALFAGASGNHQAVHIDIGAARAKGNDDVFTHGMLSMAYLERLLTNYVPQERIRSFSARFIHRVPVLAEPICRGRIIEITDGLAKVEVWLELSDGKVAVRGDALIEISR